MNDLKKIIQFPVYVDNTMSGDVLNIKRQR